MTSFQVLVILFMSAVFLIGVGIIVKEQMGSMFKFLSKKRDKK